MSRYVPRPYQPAITDHIFRLPRCNVFAGMGVGKTPATLQAISDLLLFGEVNRVLIVAPKRVAQHTWPGEVANFRESFGHLRISAAIGTDKERRAAIESGADIVTINYENLAWIVEHYGETWPFDMIVADEVSRLQGLRVSLQTSKSGKKFLTGQGGSRAKALARVAISRVKRWVGLTGTPAANGLGCLWGICWFIDAGQRLGSSFTAFSHRWFRAVPGSDPQRQRIEPLPYAEEQIRAAIKDVTIAIEAKDHFKLPPLIENNVLLDLPPAAMRQYKEMEKALFTEIAGTPIEAFNAGSKTQKCLQIASGAAYTDDKGNWAPVHDVKIDALQSVIEEAAGMPVLVAYHFKSDLARILKAFPKAVHLGADPTIIDRWNNGQIPILVAHPQSAGHGLSLQHGSNILCFFSSNWSLEADAQICERLGPTRQAQSGYNRPVFIHRLIARGTLEEVVVRRLKTKASVQDALMGAMKISR
ncbi:DNA helicase [Acidovorax phage ACPWH]|nr:DNA helicase [Acidovorax phage ACPWH]